VASALAAMPVRELEDIVEDAVAMVARRLAQTMTLREA